MNNAYIFTPGSIAVTIGGKPYNVSKQDERYNRVVNALKENDWKEAIKCLDKAQTIVNFMCGKVRVTNGRVYYKDRVLENPVTQKILEFMEQDLPYKHLVSFLRLLMLNPDPRCRQALFTFMETEALPITPEGKVLAYKSIRAENMKDWYSNTILHKIGATIRWGARKKERNSRETLDYGAPCGKFYHLGTFQYSSTFHSGENVVVLCEVSPEFVKSVPDEALEGKIRCSKYKILGFFDVNGEPLPKNVVAKGYVTNKLQDKVENR